MEKQAKKIVHIGWEEAHRAEAERDKARQALCRSLPPSRMQVLISRNVFKLRALALRFCDMTDHHAQKHLFSPEAAKKIAGYSKELPRLLGTICDKPSLVAYSIFKRPAVSAEMVKENEPAQGRKNRFKPSPTKSGIAVFAAVLLLLALGAMAYLPRSKNYLSHLTLNRGATAQQDVRSTLSPEVTIGASERQSAAPQRSSMNHDSARPHDRESTTKSSRDGLGKFEVVNDSFVRDTPQPNATIIATLRPGTHVRVESKTEEYLRIRSLSDAEIIGYVHEEDAFFQAIK